MAKTGVNLQDSFLNQIRRETRLVRVALANGGVIEGAIKGFDNFTLVLDDGARRHLIYKHAIAEIVIDREAADPPPRDGETAQRSKKAPEDDAAKTKGFNPLGLSGVKIRESDKTGA